MTKKRPRSTAASEQPNEGVYDSVSTPGSKFVGIEDAAGKHPSPEDICILCEEAMATGDEEIIELAREIMDAARCGSTVVIHVAHISPAVLELMTQARPLCCGRR